MNTLELLCCKPLPLLRVPLPPKCILQWSFDPLSVTERKRVILGRTAVQYDHTLQDDDRVAVPLGHRAFVSADPAPATNFPCLIASNACLTANCALWSETLCIAFFFLG